MDETRQATLGPPIWDPGCAYILIFTLGLGAGGLCQLAIPEELREGRIAIWTLFGMFLAGGVAALAQAVLRRRWLTFDDATFTIRTWFKERTHRFDEVEALSERGRTTRIRLANGREIRLARPGAGPFDDWEAQVERALLERARADLVARRPVHGPSWTLDREFLSVGPTALRLADLCAMDVHREDLLLWMRGRPGPVASIPIQGWNTPLLQRLLEDFVLADDPVPGDPMGRRLFEWRPWLKPGLLVGIFGLLYACIPLMFDLPRVVVAVTLAAIAVLEGWAWYAGSCRLIFHARGLEKATPLRIAAMRYADVASSRWRRGWWPLGIERVDLLPQPGTTSSPIRFRLPEGRGTGYDELRQHVDREDLD